MTEKETYNNRLQFEHELINRRLTWLLTSQSILFAALAFVLGQGELPSLQTLFSHIISILGMTLSFSILIGVLMGIAAKVTTWRDYNCNQPIGNKEPLGLPTWITSITFLPDLFMPIAFVVAWGCIWSWVA